MLITELVLGDRRLNWESLCTLPSTPHAVKENVNEYSADKVRL